MIECDRHRGVEARYYCGGCQIGLCEECVRPKFFGSTKLMTCAVCHGPTLDLDRHRPAPPFWTIIPDLLRFPFRGEGWMMFAAWVIVSLVFRVTGEFSVRYYNVLGLGALALYAGLLFSLFYRIESKFELGKFTMPDWMDFQGFESFLRPIYHFFGALTGQTWPIPTLAFFLSMATGVPFFLWEGWRWRAFVIMSVVLVMVNLFFLPMALLTVGVFNNVLLAFNPLYLWREISKVRREYLIAYAMLMVMAVCYALLQVGWSHLGAYEYSWWFLVYCLVDSQVQLYLFMVAAALLGYLAHQCRYQLRWWPETQVEPVFLIKGQPARMEMNRGILAPVAAATAALGSQPSGKNSAAPAPASAPIPARDRRLEAEIAAQIKQATYFMNYGSYPEALEILYKVREVEPDNLDALRGIARSSLALDDPGPAREAAQAIAAIFITQRAFEALLDMYEGYRTTLPELRYRPEDLLALLAWLEEHERWSDAGLIRADLSAHYPGVEVPPLPDLAPEAALDDDADPGDAQARLERADLLIARERPREAAELLDAVIRENPRDFVALGKRTRLAFKLGETERAAECGTIMAGLFLAQEAFEALWDLYQDFQEALPRFRLPPEELLAVSGWLEGRNKHLEAARVLREFAVSYQDHARAPEALLTCARLLERCGKADTAAMILRKLIELHPQSGEAEQAAALLKDGEPE